MKIEMTRYELSFVLELVGEHINDLYEAIRKRMKVGEDATSLESRLEDMEPIRIKLWRVFVENCGGTNNEENTDFD